MTAIVIFIGMKNEIVKRKEDVHIDYLGISTFIPGLVLLLLWLTFGGDKFEWFSMTSGLMLFGSILFLVLFGVAELVQNIWRFWMIHAIMVIVNH